MIHLNERVSPISSIDDSVGPSSPRSPNSDVSDSFGGVGKILQTPNMSILQVSEALEQIATSNLDPEHAHLAGLEVIARKLAYRRPNVLQRLGEQAFTLQIPGIAKPVSYRFGRMVEFGNSPIGGSLRAFSMLPDEESAPPIIVFHGTKTNVFTDVHMANTLLADIDPRGIGRSALNLFGTKLERPLDRFFDETTENGTQKAIVIGHSLGGAIAELAAIYKPSAVERAILFNAPGVHIAAFRKSEAEKAAEHYPTILRFEPGEGGGVDPIVSLGARKRGHVVLIDRENGLDGLAAHREYLLAGRDPSFADHLHEAIQRGQSVTEQWNAERPYALGLVPYHKSLFGQTVGALVAYPILTAMAGTIRLGLNLLRWHEQFINGRPVNP